MDLQVGKIADYTTGVSASLLLAEGTVCSYSFLKSEIYVIFVLTDGVGPGAPELVAGSREGGGWL